MFPVRRSLHTVYISPTCSSRTQRQPSIPSSFMWNIISFLIFLPSLATFSSILAAFLLRSLFLFLASSAFTSLQVKHSGLTEAKLCLIYIWANVIAYNIHTTQTADKLGCCVKCKQRMNAMICTSHIWTEIFHYFMKSICSKKVGRKVSGTKNSRRNILEFIALTGHRFQSLVLFTGVTADWASADQSETSQDV